MSNSLDINATQGEKYAFIIAASKGELRYEEIKLWLNLHVLNKDNDNKI